MPEKQPKLNDDDILAAYSKLPERDRLWIDYLTVELIKAVKAKWNTKPHTLPVHFGKVQALELLAKLGIYQIGGLK